MVRHFNFIYILCTSRLAVVQFSSGSGVLGLNLNPHLEIQFKLVVNTNTNPMFRFGSGSNHIQYQKISKFGNFFLA